MMKEDKETRFQEWLDRFQPLLFKVVHSFAGSPQDRSDLFQDILVQLWRSTDRFENRCSPSTWVYRVAFHTAMAWNRASRRGPANIDSIDLDAHAAPPPPDNSRIDELYAAIRQLSKPDASLILMHLDGLSYREMAEVMGLTETNVGARLNRARTRLGQLMKEIMS